jgi:Ca2+-binding RTX toxin-like protein
MMTRRRHFATPVVAAIGILTLINVAGAPGASAQLMTGTPGDDVLTGTARPDRLRGIAGNDELRGLASNDVLHGGTGTDTLIGDRGNDTLYGDEGADDIRGGYGPDRIYTYGDDQVYAGGQDDYVELSEGTVTARGGYGDDNFWVVGQSGVRTMFGEAGQDLFFADTSADVVIRAGGGGDALDIYSDTADLSGEGGDDRILYWGGGVVRGGTGADELWTAYTSYAGPKSAVVHCGPGVDTLHADTFDVVASDCENVTLGS